MAAGTSETLNEKERALCEAIWGRRVVQFVSQGCRRIAEPHDFGEIGGRRRLLFHQLGGESRSGRPYGWRWADVAELAELELLDRAFAGTRPAPSGRHQRWDRLFASVSRLTLVPGP